MIVVSAGGLFISATVIPRPVPTPPLLPGPQLPGSAVHPAPISTLTWYCSWRDVCVCVYTVRVWIVRGAEQIIGSVSDCTTVVAALNTRLGGGGLLMLRRGECAPSPSFPPSFPQHQPPSPLHPPCLVCCPCLPLTPHCDSPPPAYLSRSHPTPSFPPFPDLDRTTHTCNGRTG